LSSESCTSVIPLQSIDATRPLVELHYCFKTVSTNFRRATWEKGYWPHLRVQSLSRGGRRGHYRYPANQVPPHTSSKSRQGVGCVSMCCHASRSSEPCLPAWEGSNATTCPVAPDPAYWLRRALVLPRILRLLTLPLGLGGLRCCHASRSSRPCLPARMDPGAATHSTASMRPATLYVLLAIRRITLATQPGLHVTEAGTCVTKAN
jgi:hypothetical protein